MSVVTIITPVLDTVVLGTLFVTITTEPIDTETLETVVVHLTFSMNFGTTDKR